MSEQTSELSDEDAKLVTLARGARARISATEGAAVRDETGRTYSFATVRLPSLELSALQGCVASAVAAGAKGAEAAVVVTQDFGVDADGAAALRELAGKGVPIIVTDARRDEYVRVTT